MKKQKLKSKYGITLIALFVTVIVSLLILSYVVTQSFNFQKEVGAYEFLNKISIVETKVMVEQYKADGNTSYVFKGTELTTPTAMTVGTQTYPSGTNNVGIWYYLPENQLGQIEITDIEGDYIVNYATGQVISVQGYTIDNVTYYTFDDLAEAIEFEP